MNWLRNKRVAAGALGSVVMAVLLVSVLNAKTGSLQVASVSPVTDDARPAFATTIRPVPGPPQVLTTLTNRQGELAMVSCSSCHSTTTPNREINSSEQLQKFHQGLQFDHGALSCLSCHNEDNYDALRLANGTEVPYENVMNLCGQCHGPQLRDYQRGLHGGMNGHWDLTRGGRTRNNCIHCHDPHAPAFPVVQPVLPPKDRIVIQPAHRH